jgi:glucokinase
VLALDFGGTKIAIAVCDLAGNRVADTVVATNAEAGAVSAFDRAIATARELLLTAAPAHDLAAVAVATFGIPFDDRVELAPAIPGWETFAFGRELRAAFPGVRLAMATDVKAAALAEVRWGALVGCDPAIYLNLGTGLACAIVAGGTVITGAHGAAGEIGYNVREPADVGKSQSERITLEDVVSGKALAAIAGTEYGAHTSVAEIFDRATTEPAAARIVEAFTRELAQHVVNLVIAVDPARMAVGGGLARSWDIIAPRLRDALDAAVPFPPDLVLAQFPFDAPLIGALALGVEAATAGLAEEALR